MPDLHLSNIDDAVLAQLRERAWQEGLSLEEKVRTLLEQEVSSETGSSGEDAETLRMPSPDCSFQDVHPVQASGPSASELLIRDRDR